MKKFNIARIMLSSTINANYSRLIYYVDAFFATCIIVIFLICALIFALIVMGLHINLQKFKEILHKALSAAFLNIKMLVDRSKNV